MLVRGAHKVYGNQKLEQEESSGDLIEQTTSNPLHRSGARQNIGKSWDSGCAGLIVSAEWR